MNSYLITLVEIAESIVPLNSTFCPLHAVMAKKAVRPCMQTPEITCGKCIFYTAENTNHLKLKKIVENEK
jgi:hypothetical protein